MTANEAKNLTNEKIKRNKIEIIKLISAAVSSVAKAGKYTCNIYHTKGITLYEIATIAKQLGYDIKSHIITRQGEDGQSEDGHVTLTWS